MTKRLIVNADDFGLTKGINRGVISAFRNGIVRSASIIPVGGAFDDAIILTRENPSLDLGIHLCLTEGRPVLPADKIPSLVKKDGCFLNSHRDLVLNYISGKVYINDIIKELQAQVEKVLKTGIKITHIDSHGHIHALPSILNVVVGLAKTYEIPYIRCPNESSIVPGVRLSRYIYKSVLSLFCVFSRKNINNAGLFRTDYFFGFLNSGHLSEEYLSAILGRIKNGVTEIVCHPGICDPGTNIFKHWGYMWEEEVKVLSSEHIKKIMKDLNIELVSFRDMILIRK